MAQGPYAHIQTEQPVSQKDKRMEEEKYAVSSNLSVATVFVSPSNFSLEVATVSLFVAFSEMSMIASSVSEFPGSLVWNSRISAREGVKQDTAFTSWEIYEMISSTAAG